VTQIKADITEAILQVEISLCQELIEWFEDGVVRYEARLIAKQQQLDKLTYPILKGGDIDDCTD